MQLRKQLSLAGALLLVFTLSVMEAQAQARFDVHNPIQIPGVVCEGNPVNSYYVVPAPAGVLSRLKSGQKRSNIEVTYTGFSEEAKTAFQYAVDIWSGIIYSPVTIRIDARWEVLKSGVLGNCSPSNYYYNLEGSRDMRKYYPVALAEKIAGVDLNGTGEADIVARFNSSGVPWSFATNGIPVTNKYDLVTVVLHEICHGLGYVGNMSVNTSGVGSYGFSENDYAVIYDKYLGNSSGSMLLDASIFPPNTVTLGNALKSDKIYFFSQIAYNNNGAKYPKLYAPVTWNGGSSIYHLDDFRYDNTTNSLMTHAVDYAEVVHDPGPISLAMLQEMGWINTYIKHDTLPDVETLTAPVEIMAEITSDTILAQNSMILHYSTDSFMTQVQVPMNPAASGANKFSASIPLAVPETAVFYYISVKDTFGREYNSPSGVPDEYYSFYYGLDTIKPIIDHQPIPYVLTGVDSIEIKALVRDNLGLAHVFVEFMVNGVAQDSISLTSDTLSEYSGQFIFPDGSIHLGDTIAYRIVATDASTGKNTSYNPPDGYHQFRVEAIPAAQNEYYNNFNSADNDFILDGFSYAQPEWFYSGALHSTHPYPSPKVDGKEFNFIAQLRFPIIVQDSNAHITFFEIALVEPGESGYPYGNSNFYDYVVVEGSGDWGNTWKPFADGWDCRAYPEWLTRWNSNTDGQGNSLIGAGDEFYRARHLDMTESGAFSPGDTVLIRFRLFSDPYANGWGWAIENLGIQGVYTSMENGRLLPENLAVYPNPASDYMTVKLSGIQTGEKITISLSNLLGQVCLTTGISGQEAENGYELRLDNLQEGMYMLSVSGRNSFLTRKILIRK